MNTYNQIWDQQPPSFTMSQAAGQSSSASASQTSGQAPAPPMSGKDRLAIIRKNLANSHPTTIAANFRDDYFTWRLAQEGKTYTPPQPETVIALRYPVTMHMLDFVFQKRLEKEDEAFHDQILKRGFLHSSSAKSPTPVMYLIVKGNRRDWWAEINNFFGKGEDAVWYMKEELLVLDNMDMLPGIVAKQHFPDKPVVVQEQWDPVAVWNNI